jgi:hypothetical protein
VRSQFTRSRHNQRTDQRLIRGNFGLAIWAAVPSDLDRGRAARHTAGRAETYLFTFLGDLAGGDGGPVRFAEDTIRLAAALRPALASRGVPEHV